MPTDIKQAVRLARADIARLAAADIPDGSVVNLGIGVPTLVAKFLPADADVILHSENGILGMGPADTSAPPDYDLVNAGKELVGLVTGASICDSALSFAMMRGGHLDLSLLGGLQVSADGDLANWHTGAPDAMPAVGGAMDLAVGAKRVFVLMEHVARDGAPKIVEHCTLPLTSRRVVDRIYTDMAIIDVEANGLVVRGIVEGTRFEDLQRMTGAPLRLGADCRTLQPGAGDPR
jgi:3-oxoadipate CoA-transferase beta subunit